MQDAKPQASQHDLCPTDDGEELDTICSQVCGDIAIEPLGQLAGWGTIPLGFTFQIKVSARMNVQKNGIA